MFVLEDRTTEVVYRSAFLKGGPLRLVESTTRVPRDYLEADPSPSLPAMGMRTSDKGNHGCKCLGLAMQRCHRRARGFIDASLLV
jgi:hypothetical protein